MQNKPKPAPRRVSAAHLSVQGRAVAPTSPTRGPVLSGNAARFARLERLRDRIGRDGNQNDLAIALISACIMEGIRTEREIVRTLYHLGLNAKHAGIVVRKESGSNPAMHRWSKGEDGRYRLLS